jgi:AcrR family transcriptional regulator
VTRKARCRDTRGWNLALSRGKSAEFGTFRPHARRATSAPSADVLRRTLRARRGGRAAGVSRATLYQHFGSRLDLVDAICETFGQNPALSKLRELIADPDPERALDSTIANSVGFWASEDSVLSQIYGVAAIDPAAQSLVDRQRANRRQRARAPCSQRQHSRPAAAEPPPRARATTPVHELRDLLRAPRSGTLRAPNHCKSSRNRA